MHIGLVKQKVEDVELKILLTNDDGIQAPGLLAAARVLAQVGELHVVAPSREQSGVGSALTLHHAVEVSSVDVLEFHGAETQHLPPASAHSVHGTPADSCLLALERLVGQVDLVVSGINRGSNLGADIMVSGTVGAALQGYLRGFPTLAVSVASVVNPNYETAASLLKVMAQHLSAATLEEPFFLNINVPSKALNQIDGVQITQLGGRSYGESVAEENSNGSKGYRISRNRPIPGDNPEGTDIWAVKNNRISITPLRVNLTHGDQLLKVEGLLEGLPEKLLERRD